jgi:hypothetical protein
VKEEEINRWAWTGGAMRMAQDEDEAVSKVKAWVETDERRKHFN